MWHSGKKSWTILIIKIITLAPPYGTPLWCRRHADAIDKCLHSLTPSARLRQSAAERSIEQPVVGIPYSTVELQSSQCIFWKWFFVWTRCKYRMDFYCKCQQMFPELQQVYNKLVHNWHKLDNVAGERGVASSTIIANMYFKWSTVIGGGGVSWKMVHIFALFALSCDGLICLYQRDLIILWDWWMGWKWFTNNVFEYCSEKENSGNCLGG